MSGKKKLKQCPVCSRYFDPQGLDRSFLGTGDAPAACCPEHEHFNWIGENLLITSGSAGEAKRAAARIEGLVNDVLNNQREERFAPGLNDVQWLVAAFIAVALLVLAIAVAHWADGVSASLDELTSFVEQTKGGAK